MNIYSYARALDTVGWFLGDEGWPMVVPLLVAKMRADKLLGFGFVMHDGVQYRIRLDY